MSLAFSAVPSGCRMNSGPVVPVCTGGQCLPVCCGSAGLSLWPDSFQHNPSARRFGPALPACRPCGWNNNNWSATPSPSGHANVNLNNGNVNDNSDSNNNNAAYQVL